MSAFKAYGLSFDLPAPCQADDIDGIDVYLQSALELFMALEEKSFSLVILRVNHIKCHSVPLASKETSLPGSTFATAGASAGSIFDCEQYKIEIDPLLLCSAGGKRTSGVTFAVMYCCRWCGQSSFDRPEAVLAKQINTLDVVTKGRALLLVSGSSPDLSSEKPLNRLSDLLSGKFMYQDEGIDKELNLRPRWERENSALPLGVIIHYTSSLGNKSDSAISTQNAKLSLSLGAVLVDANFILQLNDSNYLDKIYREVLQYGDKAYLIKQEQVYVFIENGAALYESIADDSNGQSRVPNKAIFDFGDYDIREILKAIKG